MKLEKKMEKISVHISLCKQGINEKENRDLA
jgi:hypothetical protein